MSMTIEYIARLANVSKATVSRVINNKAEGVGKETRARVQAIIDEYNYRPNLLARGVATSQTKTIGLVIPDITNPFFPAVVKSIERYANLHGYSVILCDTDSSPEKERRYLSTLIASRVDGVILATALDEKCKWNWEFAKYNIPCVLIDRRFRDEDYSASVFVDNAYAIYLATELLIKNGNRKVAFIKGPENLSTTSERLEGYRSALKQYRIPFDEALVVCGNYSFEGGYEATKGLLTTGLPFTAVMSSNDMMAIGAMRALHERRLRIPGDVEIIGFDNIVNCSMVDPPLTTMEQPIFDLGKKAAESLIALMGGRTLVERDIRLEAKLVLRESTKNLQKPMKQENGRLL